MRMMKSRGMMNSRRIKISRTEMFQELYDI